MGRLTEKDEQGNWCVKGLPWDMLHEGQVISRNVSQKLYGCLYKLMRYEDTGMSPEEIEDSMDEANGIQLIVSDDGKARLYKPYASLDFRTKEDWEEFKETFERMRWIPCNERLPERTKPCQVEDFEVTIIPDGDKNPITCHASYDYALEKWMVKDCEVIAWQPLPKPYMKKEE